MKTAKVYVDDIYAGRLFEVEPRKKYRFEYLPTYKGYPVSFEMPLYKKIYEYDKFPPYFEGVLPEGVMLEGLLKLSKIDRDDLMSQLLVVGHDLVGNVTVIEETKEEKKE